MSIQFLLEALHEIGMHAHIGRKNGLEQQLLEPDAVFWVI
jgi:hypothetical protein